MSTSASFRAFIPALTFFFAIARPRRRIRAAQCVVVVADSVATRDGPPRDARRTFASIDDVDSRRSTTRRSIQKSIDDASIYFSTTRTSIDRPIDRPRARDAFNSIRSSIVDATRRRDASTTSDFASTDDRRSTIERATRSRRTRRERTRGDDDDDDDDDDDAFDGNHRTRAGDGCARATTARDARARRATRGGRDGARDAVATRARGRERVRWFDAGEAGARIANASIRLDGSDADAAGRTRRRDDGKGARV